MTEENTQLPHHSKSIQQRYPKLSTALADLGSAVREAGPLDTKTGHLIQLAAAAAIRAEGSVHSHTRRNSKQGQA